MRGTTTTTLLLQSRALCELRAATQNAVRPSSAGLRAAATSSAPRQLAVAYRPFHTIHSRLRKMEGRTVDNFGTKFKDKSTHIKPNSKPKSSGVAASASKSSAEKSSQHPTPNPEEPFDFADVHSRLAKVSEAPLENLKKLKAGGRFNPDLIGAVRVQVDKKDGGASYPLRELAQVVPKGGRTISILVHEAESIKPIMSAIQASKDFNQQPQRDPDNELELVLKMELEKRGDVAKRVKAVCHEWREKARQVRHRRDKTHATWKKDGVLLPDDKRKADAELDKIMRANTAKIDAAEKEATKAAEGK